MATVSVSYLWIALEVRGAQERAAGKAILARQGCSGLSFLLLLSREPVNRPRKPPTKGLTGGLNRQPDG